MNQLENIAKQFEGVSKDTHKALEIASRLADEYSGDTNAHLMARNGFWFSVPDVLRLKNRHGETVLDCMAQCGNFIKNEEVYLEVREIAYRPLVYGIKMSIRIKNKELLKLSNEEGITLAHHQAAEGDIFVDPEILALTTNGGLSVADILYGTSDNTPRTGKH